MFFQLSKSEAGGYWPVRVSVLDLVSMYPRYQKPTSKISLSYGFLKDWGPEPSTNTYRHAGLLRPSAWLCLHPFSHQTVSPLLLSPHFRPEVVSLGNILCCHIHDTVSRQQLAYGSASMPFPSTTFGSGKRKTCIIVLTGWNITSHKGHVTSFRMSLLFLC